MRVETKDVLFILSIEAALRLLKLCYFFCSLCPTCRIFTLGNYDKKPTYAYTDEVGT